MALYLYYSTLKSMLIYGFIWSHSYSVQIRLFLFPSKNPTVLLSMYFIVNQLITFVRHCLCYFIVHSLIYKHILWYHRYTAYYVTDVMQACDNFSVCGCVSRQILCMKGLFAVRMWTDKVSSMFILLW